MENSFVSFKLSLNLRNPSPTISVPYRVIKKSPENQKPTRNFTRGSSNIESERNIDSMDYQEDFSTSYTEDWFHNPINDGW